MTTQDLVVRILTVWNALNESTAFGKAGKQGMESIIKSYTKGNSLFAMGSSVVGEVNVDLEGMWSDICQYLDTFILDELDKYGNKQLQDIKKGRRGVINIPGKIFPNCISLY